MEAGRHRGKHLAAVRLLFDSLMQIGKERRIFDLPRLAFPHDRR